MKPSFRCHRFLFCAPALLVACATGAKTANDAGPAAAPQIAVFAASPTALGVDGGTATLVWTTTGATSATIDHEIGTVDVAGVKDVSVTATTMYTLTATGPGGSVTQTVTVEVTPAQLFVDPMNGTDTNDGTQASPLKTLTKAFSVVLPGQTIMLADGIASDATGETFPLNLPDGVTVQATHTGSASLQGSQTTAEEALIFAGSGSLTGLSFEGFSQVFEATTGAIHLTDLTLTNNQAVGYLSGDAQVTATNVTVASTVQGAHGYDLEDTASLTTSGGSLSGFGPNCSGGVYGVTLIGSSTLTLDGTNMSDILGPAIEADDDASVILKNATFDNAGEGFCGSEASIELGGIASVSLQNMTLTNVLDAVYAFGDETSISIDGSTISSVQNAVESGGGNVTITSTTVTGVTRDGVYCSGYCTVQITGSSFTNAAESAVELGGGGNLKLRSVGLYSIPPASARGITVDDAYTRVDLGTSVDLGNNVFGGNTYAELYAPAIVTNSSTIQAVGNTWDHSTQGADSSGLYSAQLVTGPVSGQNYVLGTGGKIQF